MLLRCGYLVDDAFTSTVIAAALAQRSAPAFRGNILRDMPLSFQRRNHLVEPERSATTQTVENAFLTPFERQRIPSLLHSPRFFQFGAVYNEHGDLIPESQRWGGFRGDFLVAADPSRVVRTPAREHLAGNWLYAGNWMGQFGHWITETLPNFWSIEEVGRLDGIVAHPFIFGNDETAWQRIMLDAAGASGLPLKVIGGGAVTVERLHLPSRPVVLNAFALPEAAKVWERVGSRYPGSSHTRVFLSVLSYREGPDAKPVDASRTFSNQRDVDRLFRACGFHVVAPESLSIEEQIELVRGADILAGWSGSALHLAAFARSSTRVLELGDMRSGASPVPQQQVISAARAQEHAFVQAGHLPGDSSTYDVPRLAALLNELT